jgi:hypothetical protein
MALAATTVLPAVAGNIWNSHSDRDRIGVGRRLLVKSPVKFFSEFLKATARGIAQIA